MGARGILFLLLFATIPLTAPVPPVLAQETDDPPATAVAERPAFPFRASPTDLLLRGETDDAPPRAMVRVEITRPLEHAALLVVRSLDGEELARSDVSPQSGGRVLRLPIPLPPEVGVLPVDVVLHEGEEAHLARLEVPRPDPDWVLHFIPGFHYDPVWWNTQEHYTETGHFMDAHVGPGIELVGEYLDTLESDDDLTVAFHQLPYLKSFLEARPWRRDELMAAVAAGRAGIVGGTYNELSSTLVSAEAVVRNAAYGTLWQREVLGGSGDVFWQCDVFGHDPSFPSLMRASGHRAGVFGRGPFHQWGIDRDRVNFPSEFLWTAPDGTSILTHYMTGHYGYAYAAFASGSNRAPDDRTRTRAIIAGMFEDLKQPALTHHVLLPMHMDFIRPLENLGDVVRDWNATFLAPRAVVGDSDGFFDAVEAEIAERDIAVPVITRDMNPIYTGCGVSFSDLKIAERQVETLLREAEIFATLAAIEGAAYPHRLLDRAWRQLLFHAHHDAVTGSSSDQVYIDLLWGIRDALDIAHEVRFAALASLAAKVGGSGALVWNSLARPLEGTWGAEDVQDGRLVLHEGTLPALGVRRLEAVPLPDRPSDDPDRPVLENEFLRVTFDLDRGGTIVSLVDRETGEELLDGPANEVVLVEEYPVLPGHGEGPWHLAPTGEKRRGTDVRARARWDSARPYRIELETRRSEYTLVQRVELLPGQRRIDCETRVERWRGRNQLLRVEFPFRHPGARPIYQTAGATIGRPFSRDVDTAKDPWTLDQVTGQWVGLGAVSTITIVPADGEPIRRAIGVGEIVIASNAPNERVEEANDIARALVSLGVTTTTTRSEARRYGNLAEDSNLPDFRLFLGSAEELAAMREAATLPLANSVVEEANAPIIYAEPRTDDDGSFVDVDLPTLVVRADPLALRVLATSLAREDEILVPGEAARLVADRPSVARRGVAIVNDGTVSCRVEEGGRIALNLLRSCTSWPSGIWIDPPNRAHPDGSPLGAMHGSHRFAYSILPFRGDHRTDEVAARAAAVQSPPLRQLYRDGTGEIPDGKSWLSIEPAGVLLTALKPGGFPLARWDDSPEDAPVRTVVARLWNGGGTATRATLRPGFSVISALRTDLLESAGVDLPIAPDGSITIELAPYAFATVAMRLDLPFEETTPLACDRLPDAVSSPWLENRGEGSDGNGIIAIAPEERELVLGAEGARTTLHIVNGHRSEAVSVPLTVRGPTALAVTLDPPQVQVAAGESVAVALTVTARTPWTGRAALELSATLPTGELLAAVWVRDPTTEEGAPPFEWVVDETLVEPRGELRATLRNLTDGPLRGVAAWITPQPAWGAIADWREAIDLPSGGEVEFVRRLAHPIDSYAIPRFTAAGEIAYGPAVALLELREQVILSFEGDRVRIPESGVGLANLTARARRGLSADSAFEFETPEGWTATELGRQFHGATDDQPVQILEMSYAIGAPPTGGGGTLVARGPGRSHAVVDTTVAPAQRARAGGSEITVDGEFDDWSADEFTSATGPLGSVRTAVRYDTGGLVFAMDVADESFRQTHSAATIWEGDSVQVALTAAPGTEIGYANSDLEFGAARTPHGPLVWCWYAGPGGRTGRVEEAEVAVVPHEGGIRYEFRIPRTRLPGINLEPGGVLGFSYIANDDDGTGYRGATEWTPGMTGTKDSSLFGEMFLQPR